MSFTDNYLALYEEEKKKKKKKTTAEKTGHSFTDKYLSLSEQEKDESIAPVYVNKTAPALYKADDIAPVAKEDEERTWFRKGAFDDGYQFGDVTKTILGTASDLGENLAAGVLGMGERVVDAGAYLAGGVGKMFGADEFAEDTKEFISKDLYNEEEIAKRIILGSEENSVLGEKSDSLVQSAGQLGATIGLQAVGVPWFVTTGLTSFGGEVEGAFNEGASFGEAGLSAAISAGAEILTEKISGGISFGGKTLDAALTNNIARNISNRTVRTLSKLGVDMAGEGLEEVLSGVMGAIGKKITYADDKELTDLFSTEEALESFIGGAVLGGGMGGINAVKSGVKGVDYASGLTANEEKVVNKVYEDRVKEAEKSGKLSEKEKSKIYDEVLSEMEKGGISTDTIEEVLGGETFKNYQNTVKNEDSLRETFNQLNQMKQGEMTGEQIDLRNELKEQLKELESKGERNQLKSQLGSEVMSLVHGDRLIESYNERYRKGQAFEADLTKYNEKQRVVVQKAIDSGILNNTRRTHEFVDMVSKISADKGVLFDFANNAKLKESGFAVDGKTVNGFVTKDGVTLNIDAAKSLNSVVGHEITHVLEGTELYTELQSILKTYAESKGEYQIRYDSLKELYKDIKDADIDAELTADLVGDYLFTDSDFINNLSTNHRNVFQKIYDEVKYLCKVATAGSKEARELEKVKRAFEKAYQEGGKQTETKAEDFYDSATKYSLRVTDKDTLDFLDNQETVTTYKTMQLVDGKLYPPMASRIEGQFEDYSELGAWEQATEHPELIKNGNKFKLDKGKGQGSIEAAYNPYMHSSNLVLNDQFSGAYKRDNLVTVECEVPVSELTSGYHAEFAKDSVGWHPWHTGTVAGQLRNAKGTERQVLLSRWIKPVRIVPDSEVAAKYKELLDGTNVEVPDNVVTPALLNELKKAGVKIKESGRVKYSVSDSDGKQLSKEQQDYFKDSKMRDENGNLKVMYHGSQDAGFHVFDASMSDDNTSFFFVDRNDVAASYSGTTETYEAKTIRTAEDMNNFLAEIGHDEDYSVIEQDGKFTLLYDGDRVAQSDTAQGIYKEFCWYEGVGEGDANYKVYLNLKNPLMVDAEGRNWDKVGKEFSQKLYDVYQSFTDEEKSALKDLAEWEDFGVFKDELANSVRGKSKGTNDAYYNALASAYLKSGFDVNALFEMATADFAEEAIRETAWDYLNTRDYAQRAKEQGYDGVIFNNIVDVGGYGNGSEGAATVAIAFDSNQIKSVANEKPTAHKDIRYSISGDNERVFYTPRGVEVVQNPTNAEYRQMREEIYKEYPWLRGTGEAILRHTYDESGNEYYWNAFEGMHRDVEPYINKQYNTRTSQQWEWWKRADKDDYPADYSNVRYSLSDTDYNQLSYAEISLEQQNLRQRESRLEERKREANNNPELLQALDDYHGYFSEMKTLFSKRHAGTATQEELNRIEEIKGLRDEKLKRVADIQESLGLSAIAEEEREIRELRESLRVASDAAWAREGAEKENKAIEKSGLSAPEYFRKKALKAFKTTANFNEAGYMLPDGKLLNFSGGERNHRYRDHREIGEIYEATQGTAALNRFLNDGNIRIMAESPGIDLASGVEPTKEQYVALRRFINSHGTKEGQFFVDFSGTEGNRVGNYSYEGRVNADRVLNDIKYFYQNGEVREQSSLGKFLSLSKNGEQIAPVGKYNVFGKDIALETVSETESVQETQVRSEENLTSAPASEVVSAENATTTMFPDDLAPITDDAGRIESLTDADAPPETEAPYYEYDSEELEAEDPFEDRDWYEVSNRKVKAYMYDHPEVKPFFQAEAAIMLDELTSTTKGEKWYDDHLFYESGGEEGWGGTKRHTSDSIATMLDSWNMSYADIEKGLRAIIEDHGAENIAAAKKIEFMLNDRLLNGYKSFVGYEPTMDKFGRVPQNQDYINMLAESQIVDAYSKESFEALMAEADKYAPPISEEMDDIAPVTPKAETPKKEAYEAIRPKREKQPKLVRATPEEQAQILADEPKVEKKKRGFWSMAKELAVDKGAVFEDLSLATGNRELQARYNSIRYADARAQRRLEKNLKPIMDTVNDSGKTKSFYEYLYHMLNVDRMTLADRYEDVPNKPVFGNAVTADKSREAAKRLEQLNPEFKQWAEDIYDFNRQNREMLVEGGVISQEVADLWEEMYPHYVPIRRAGDTGLNVNVPLDTGRTGVNAPIKRATGGSRDILPLFDTMGQRTVQTYKAIAKNRFGVELKNTLGTTIDNEALGLDEAIDSVDTHEELLQEGKNGQKPTFTVFENGEKVTFEITDEMYSAMKPTNEVLARTYKIPNAINNFRRGTLTEYNPWFLLKNAVKDTQDVLINSQHPARTYASIPKAIVQMTTGGQWYQEYMENGGDQNSYFDGQTNTFKDKSAWDTVKKVTGLDAISKANNIIERLPRLAEYIASREAGRSVDVAMLDAARVTTNFAAGGDFTKFLNRNGFTFLNASVQGATQQVRNLREAKMNGLRGWASLAGKFAVAGIPALMLNNLMWDDDEEYEELSDYVKESYYIVGKYNDGQFVRIPKGRTVAVIQSAMEQISNAATGNDEVDLRAFVDLVITNLAPNNPLDNNILSPIVDVVTNEAWYGGDLVPTRLQDLPKAEQYDESTDSISRWLGETFNVSPYKANYLLDQYSGVIGDTFLPMLTPEAESGDNTLSGNMIAPLKDMFTTDAVMNNQNVSDFYDTKDELAMNAKMKDATDEDILMSKYMNSVNSELSELYALKREVQNSDLPDDRKYAKVREIQEEIVSLTRDSLNTYKNVYISDGYAEIGDRHYVKKNGEWTKLTDKQLNKQEEVIDELGISGSDYWSDKDEYDFAYEYPEKYTVAKSVGGFEAYKGYQSELYDIKADKDENGDSIRGSRKEKVADYINSLDADYGVKIILFKSEYNADDTYNYDIIDYLNGREDISYEEMETILKELGFDVSDDGTISWD